MYKLLHTRLVRVILCWRVRKDAKCHVDEPAEEAAVRHITFCLLPFVVHVLARATDLLHQEVVDAYKLKYSCTSTWTCVFVRRLWRSRHSYDAKT